MATNTYRIPGKNKEHVGIFSLLEKFLRIDQTLTEVIHVKFLPQILFASFLCVVYIGNRHYAEKKVKAISDLEQEVNDLRADYTTLKADYMYASKQSEVVRRAKKIGLIESKGSPTKIEVKDGEY